MLVTLLPSASSAAGAFNDDDGNPHEANIEAIAAAGITNGCNQSNTRYCPSAPVTRAEMAVFLIRAIDRTGDLGGYQGLFPDVPAGQWYTSSIELAAEIGITNGYTDGTFKPGQIVSRAEMAALILRALGETAGPSRGVFADVSSGAWFAPWTDQMYEMGITAGCSTDPLRYCPFDAVRRDEMATFLARALGIAAPVTPGAVPPITGYPDASNTGVPEGTVLKASESITIETPGTVIDGYDVSGTIYVRADNVTIRNTRVRAANFWVIRVEEGLRGVVIEDCELDGGGTAGEPGSRGVSGPADVRRCEVTGVENGLVPWGNQEPIVLEGNYVHGLAAPGAPHYDGIEIGIGRDITVRGNTVVNEYDQTAAFGIWNDFGPVSNILVENNRFIGGGYSVYVRGDNGGGSVSGITIRNNRLGKGRWGYASIVDSAVNWTANVDDATGSAVSD